MLQQQGASKQMKYRVLVLAFDLFIFGLLIVVTMTVFDLRHEQVTATPHYVPIAGFWLVLGAVILLGLRVWLGAKLVEKDRAQDDPRPYDYP